MHSTDYVQERSILIAAINDNNDRLMSMELANLGTLSGIRSGTAFPNSPAPKEADLFFRTDEGKMYVYHNSVWSDDPSLAYARTIAWVKGYGLGDSAKDITGTDLNTLDVTGFYKGNGLLNSPNSNTTDFFFIQNIKHDNLWRKQIAYPFTGATGNSAYVRIQSNGTWGVWNKVAMETQEAWINGTLQNGWTGGVSFYKNNMGDVKVTGSIGNGTKSPFTNLFTLPVGYRPANNRFFIVGTDNGTNESNKGVLVQIQPNGVVNISNTSSLIYMTLDGINFRAEQ
jgi:hypothetical protein